MTGDEGHICDSRLIFAMMLLPCHDRSGDADVTDRWNQTNRDSLARCDLLRNPQTVHRS